MRPVAIYIEARDEVATAGGEAVSKRTAEWFRELQAQEDRQR